MNRRQFIHIGSLTALGSASQKLAASTTLLPTPSETAGPFYPVVEQKDKDFDLTQIKGRLGKARGKSIEISGKVVDTHGQILEDVTVELWQANAAGRYHHPSDTNRAPVDENFQGWAIVPTGKTGAFRFKTVLPGAYPVGNGWVRPPHIHFKLNKPGYRELTTQMYFPQQALNEVDRLLMRKSSQEKQGMIAQMDKQREDGFYFQVVMQAL